MRFNLHGRQWLFAAVFLTFGRVAPGQWSSDPGINTPVCVNGSFQLLQQVISDGAGGSIIVWQDFRSPASDIYAQRLNPDGIPLWMTNGVPVSVAAQHQTSPQVVTDGAGGCIVAWKDARNSITGDIYAQRLSPTGALLWPPTGVAVCTATDEQITINMAVDGAGGAIITWNDVRSGNIIAYDIYAQRLNSAGAPLWTANGILVAGSVYQNDRKSLLADGVGGIYIAWNGRAGGVANVLAQRINSAGVSQWAAGGAPVCTAPGDQLIPNAESICSDNAGGIIVSWSDSRSTTQDVYAQRLNGSGTPQWLNNGLPVTTAAGEQYLPFTVSDGAGGAIIGFQSGEIGSRDILAQRLNSAGEPQWTINGVNVCTATGDQITRPLIGDGAGGAVLTWLDERDLDNGFDVYAQRLNSAGQPQWTTDGQAICTAAGSQYLGLASAMVSDGAGGTILAWEDGRINSGIYANRISASGALGPVSAISSWDKYY